MKQQIVTIFGKLTRLVSQIKGGGGSALPGLLVERIDPFYLQRTLSQLSHGVVLVSGTNGKTTTTKMVVELLQSQQLRVFTNRTGSNFTRGIVAALIESVDRKGILPFDIAVLELDEAYAVKFSSQIKPTYSLFLNVLRDQLDRFGEIDATATMLQKVAQNTTAGVVINLDDPRLGSKEFVKDVTASVWTYGVSEAIARQFPSDDDMRNTGNKPVSAPNNAMRDTTHTGLESFEGSTAVIGYGGKNHNISLRLKGIYNIQNATAAVALTRLIVGEGLHEAEMLRALSSVTPAFGRGEDIKINNQTVELVLVKNPSGFRLSLASFPPKGVATMIAINDNYADGRDMSWLWDVDFHSLQPTGVAAVTGIRAYDMALRLQYDEVDIRHVDTDIVATLHHFIGNNPGVPLRIFCTYTAMLALRKELSKMTKVEKVL